LVALLALPLLLSGWSHLGTVLMALLASLDGFRRFSVGIIVPLVGAALATIISTFSVYIFWLSL